MKALALRTFCSTLSHLLFLFDKKEGKNPHFKPQLLNHLSTLPSNSPQKSPGAPLSALLGERDEAALAVETTCLPDVKLMVQCILDDGNLISSQTSKWDIPWGYNPLILTIDPNFQRDIQAGETELFVEGVFQKGPKSPRPS